MRFRCVAVAGLVLVAMLGSRLQADTDTVEALVTPYMKAVDSPAYMSATSRDPHYENASLWPLDSKKAYYAKQVWPKGRLWVWAKPGQSMGGGQKALELINWLEDGKTPTASYDQNTDFEFPSGPDGKGYTVAIDGEKSRLAVRRHMTVHQGVTVVWVHQANGNTWIKKGGILRFCSSISGNLNTFQRNDNAYSWWMCDHVHFNKATTASHEIIGPFSVDDSFHFNSGMIILAEETLITPQARCTLNIQKNATLVLLSGATFRKQSNQTFGTDLIVRGRLLGGLPERPLTKDCFLLGSWKGKTRFFTVPGWRVERPDDVALIVMPEFSINKYVDGTGWVSTPHPAGSIRVHSINPAKARLVLDWHGLDIGNETRKTGQENFEKLKEVKDHYLEMYLLGDVQLDGVVFNHIAKEGLIVKDPAAAMKNWGNVTFGPDNAGTPQELFKKWDGKAPFAFNNPKDY